MEVEIIAQNPPGAISGIGRYVREIYHQLSEKIPVNLLRPIFPPLSDQLSLLRAFPLGIKNHKPENLVHFTQIIGCAQMLWRPIHPSIVSVHDLGVLVCKEDELLLNKIDRKILNLQFMGLKKADHFVVHSEFTRDGLISKLGINQADITILPTWINTTYFRPINDTRNAILDKYGLSINSDTILLLYIGSELPRKNLGFLLQAVSQIRENGKNVELIKVGGSGGEKWRIRFKNDIVKYGLQEQVHFLGVVPEDDLPAVINSADICTTPTLLESTFAWVSLSAMACGKPSVVTKNALIPEDATPATIVVANDDLDGYVQAIIDLIDDPDLRAMKGRLGRNIILHRYDSRETVSGLIKIYKKFG